jgi:acetyl esterase
MRKLSPKLEKWLQAYNQLIEKLAEEGFKQTPTNAREGLANLTWTWVKKRLSVKWVQDDLVEGDQFNIPIRVYHPQPEQPLPVLVYFHGGGHMAGSITVYDPICRRLARETNHIVISVDYRLAPECPYPAGIDDAITVVRNLWAPLQARKVNYSHHLSIAGDSGGGAICATIVHMTQYDEDIDIRRQVLIYPSLDYTLQSESVNLNGEGYLLHKDKVEWFLENYFQNRENRKEASPLYMKCSHHIPKSLVITAEFCPLRDEGLAYVQKLHDAGIETELLHFDDMIHAFLNMEDLVPDECTAVYQKIATFLNTEQ